MNILYIYIYSEIHIHLIHAGSIFLFFASTTDCVGVCSPVLAEIILTVLGFGTFIFSRDGICAVGFGMGLFNGTFNIVGGTGGGKFIRGGHTVAFHCGAVELPKFDKIIAAYLFLIGYVLSYLYRLYFQVPVVQQLNLVAA